MISWFVLAALCGAVISSLASMLNSASTIATMDLYAKFTGVTDSAKLVGVGRFFVVVFVLLAAPGRAEARQLREHLRLHPGIPGLHLAGHPRGVHLRLLLAPHAPLVRRGRHRHQRGRLRRLQVAHRPVAGFQGLVVFRRDRLPRPDGHLLLHRACLIGIIITIVKPMPKPVVLPVNEEIELESSTGAKVVGVGVVVVTIALYAIFW